MTVLTVPQGSFELQRRHQRDRSPLRAWDAADEYLLRHTAESPPAGRHWLVVNDAFGALTVALAARRPTSWSDSLIAHRSALANLERNGVETDVVALLPSTTDPTGPIDVAMIKVPRSNALLEDQLRRLRPHLTADATVTGAAMVKRLPRSAIDLFEQIIGPTSTSLARKKARLLHAHVDPGLAVGPSPFPTTVETDRGLRLVNEANVFSRDHLDLGTRLLLDNLPEFPDVPASGHVVDLGCGNGVLGTAIALANPAAHVRYVDVSYMAVASARATHAANGAAPTAVFEVAEGLENVDDDSVDVIVNNPPFHEDQAVGDEVAWSMFTQSRAALRAGGELRVVGNRHLGYHTKLKRIFGNCETVASNPKFVVLAARR